MYKKYQHELISFMMVGFDSCQLILPTWWCKSSIVWIYCQYLLLQYKKILKLFRIIDDYGCGCVYMKILYLMVIFDHISDALPPAQ